MLLFLLAYLGGVLTIVSPCILPVLPFVFARADRPFLTNGLPMLAGMAATFAAVATLAAVAGGWAVAANEWGRFAAIALLALFGAALLVPRLAGRLTRPLVALGGRLTDAAGDVGTRRSAVPASLLLGIATGLLWAPCAGPVLGLILTGAALNGANAQTSLLLLAYALGAATSLALALRAFGRAFAALKRSLGAGEWIRRGLGAAVLAAVAAIVLGLDTGLLTRVSLAGTTSIEHGLIDRLRPMTKTAAQPAPLPVVGFFPPLTGATDWLNSPPLTREGLQGKVVLVQFWTYSCINCLRTLPYLRAWAEKYKDQGLVVIGVHSPEFAFERNVDNVRKAVADLDIGYPVAIDNSYAVWQAFDNQYWPAQYIIDAKGRIRHEHFGEEGYDESERVIQQLLAEAGHADPGAGLVAVSPAGVEAASDPTDVGSPETYVGFRQARGFASPGGAVPNAGHAYEPGTPRLNQWGLAGDWTVGGERASLNQAGGGIVYRFHARDLHLVLGPGPDGRPVRFRVTIDGAAPGGSHGSDADADGRGTVTEHRLYQLVRQDGPVADRSFEIRFLDPDVQAYAFTFG
ncbi:cytochrome c biogenesis protein DipZ [Inquilinus sp. Marseille-Q2685]|uniref:cytochrome c biogenesis protein DipZ n=1 Tax=Inquilinus sp. Marseille-Q2685 TaxID=2866581 RepID=UPI001CE3E42A|nr:cytochrome c biogenesis protein CcdA [Inquilinus sp. Marseille-Q2685]